MAVVLFAAVAVGTTGTGNTRVGNDARSGAITSVGPVSVLHRAFVEGGILSAGSIFVESDAHVSGASSTGPVTLPALPPLASFSVPTGSGIVVTTTRTLAPGAYASVTANGGSTLIFSGGDFQIGSLTINANVTLRAASNTRLFVKSALIFRSAFRTAGGQVQPVFLGFAGTSASLEAPFNGTLLAPNGSIALGIAPGLSYSGSFYAKGLSIGPGNTLVCADGQP